MAVKRQSLPPVAIATSQQPSTRASATIAQKQPTLALPTARSVPSRALEDGTWLIYGPKKIGKTSLAAQFPAALFAMFEPGAKSLSIYQMAMPRWEHFRELIRLLKADPNRGGFKTVVVDTGYEAYERCLECVCRENGIDHPGGQDDYGKSWNKVSTEFRRQHVEILAMGLGLVVLCHDKLRTSESLAGQKYDQIVPNLSSAADSYYRASIDNVCFYHYRGKDRFLQLRGSDYVFAGVGTQSGFLTPEGAQVYAVPMGTNPAQAYENVKRAFANQQKQTFRDETEKYAEEQITASIRRNLMKKSKR